MIPLDAFSDAEALVVNINTIKAVRALNQRRLMDVADVRELLERKEVRRVAHIRGSTNPLDCATKEARKTLATRTLLKELLATGVYVPDETGWDA